MLLIPSFYKIFLYNFYNHKFGYNGNVKSVFGQQKEGLNIINDFNFIVVLLCVITKPVNI